METKQLSEFVQQLSEILRVYGDRPVYLCDAENGQLSIASVTNNRPQGCVYVNAPLAPEWVEVDR